jgi:hypothetical protein
MADAKDLFIRVIDGNAQEKRNHFDASKVTFVDLPVFGDFRDNYTVLASRPGYQSAGFRPVKLSSEVPQSVDLMLLPKKWRYAALLARGVVEEVTARTRYEALLRDKPASAAGLLNIMTAMQQIHLPVGTPVDYLQEIIWDESLAQDRFFAWADSGMVQQVMQACAQGLFEPEVGPGLFHPGATRSWKQIQFGEANVQLTFHENDTREVGGTNCVKVEPDIDYYQDLGSHAILEVVPSAITGDLSDPNVVYVLRWIAGRHAGVPEFNPLYTIESA